jgi:DNA-binding transcriptional regulator YiaG
MAFDPDFGKTGFARDLFRLRFRRLRIDQPTFAKRFGLSFGAVKDQEQSRCRPSRALKVLVAAIEMDPELMERAAREADARWGSAK